MIIKYGFIGDKTVVSVPDNDYWEIRLRMVDERGFEVYGLYLILKDKEFMMRDADYWCSGRPSLPDYIVGGLYEEMVEVIAKRIADDPNLRLLDIDAIESELLSAKYEQWLEKGYIKLDANGSW